MEFAIQKKVSQAVAAIRGYAGVPPDESALMVVVAQQPVCDAQLTLHLIFNIINQEPNEDIAGLASTMLLLLLVTDKLAGATWDSEEPWCNQWGEGGYMRIAKDTFTPQRLCAIASYTDYPVM